MRIARTIVAVIGLGAASGNAQLRPDEPTRQDYVNLVNATRAAENLQETARVSAEVFAKRNQGSDRDVAALMTLTANAKLEDVKTCFIDLYRERRFTRTEISELVAFFGSPLGQKLVRLGQKKLDDDIRRGSPGPGPVGEFSEAEKQQVRRMQQNASYQKYGRMVADRAFSEATMACVLKPAGVKPPVH
jgi:hypothetical protein